MPTAFLQLVTISSNLILFFLIGWFLWSLSKERAKVEERLKELEKKEGIVDGNYQQAVDNALLKEKKIIEDATQKASSIISGAQQITNSTQQSIDAALKKLAVNLQNEAQVVAGECLTNYKGHLDQLSKSSMTNFQTTTKTFEEEMDNQLKQFRESLLPALQKELETYKLQKIQEADKKVNVIIQNVSQKVLNKTISSEDHEKLIIYALEKARNEGVFE